MPNYSLLGAAREVVRAALSTTSIDQPAPARELFSALTDAIFRSSTITRAVFLVHAPATGLRFYWSTNRLASGDPYPDETHVKSITREALGLETEKGIQFRPPYDGDSLMDRVLTQHGFEAAVIVPLPLAGEVVGLCVLGFDAFPPELQQDPTSVQELAETLAAVFLAQAPALRAVPLSVEAARPASDMDRLLVAAKNASVGALAGALVHEVNNPVGHIALAAGQIQKLESSGQTTSEALSQAVQLARDIVQSTRQVRAVVSDHQAAGGISSGVHVAGFIDVRRILLAAISMTQIGHRSRARFEIDVKPDLPETPPTFANLGPALVSILNNAIEAIPEDGAPHVIQIHAAYEQGALRVCVSDDGRGIDSEVLPLVFLPLFSTRPSKDRAGLGLSLAHAIVERLGGKITIDSTPGQGTRVSVILPVDA